MKNNKFSTKEKTEFLTKIAPGISRQMSNALQVLSLGKIRIEFKDVKNYKVNKLFVEIGEKCFGTSVSFRNANNDIKGMAIAIFPLSNMKPLIELFLKRYFSGNNRILTDHAFKLSAFKEAANILIITYINGVANAMKEKFTISIPQFESFKNIELIKPALLQNDSKPEDCVSVAQFAIISEDTQISSIKARFIVVF